MPDLFNVCKHHTTLKYSGQESKKQFAVYNYDTSVTLKQGRGHQNRYDRKQGQHNAKFENTRLNSIGEKTNDKVFVKSGNTSVISLECVRKSETAVYS